MGTPHVSFRGWKLMEGAWVSEPVYYRKRKKDDTIVLGDRSGNVWTMPLANFGAVERCVGAPCRSRKCRAGKLDILISVERKELEFVCGKCGCRHKLTDGKPYPIVNLESFYARLVGGDLGHYV